VRTRKNTFFERIEKMSSRPRSNDSRKKQGIQAKKKRDAKKEPATPKDEIEKAKKALKREVLRYANANLTRAFNAFGKGMDITFLISLVGMEITRLQQTQDPNEPPDFRYTAAMHKYVEMMRKLLLIQEGAHTFIPNQIAVMLESVDDEEEDVSDVPEFA
tara:strand:+ start:80 stop:559 length:480 start_codon:yes stop_codon:yes gene_type:complete